MGRIFRPDVVMPWSRIHEHCPPSHRPRRAAPLARRHHDRLRGLGHAAAVRQRARRAQRRTHPGRALRPVPHGRDHRHRPRGRGLPELRAGGQHRHRRQRPGPLHDDRPGGRRDRRRPDRLPPRRDGIYGRRQRGQRPDRAGRADRARRRLRRPGARRPGRVRAARGPGPGVARHHEGRHRRRPGRAEVLRGPAGHGRRGSGAHRPYRLHRRGRLRAVRRTRARRAAVAGADRGRMCRTA